MSTPISNIVSLKHDDYRMWLDEYMGLYEYIDSQRLVKYFQQTLGRQDFCWTGEYRYWVWESKESEAWRIFVGKGGFSFEVNPAFDGKQALDAWSDFVKCLNVEREVLRERYQCIISS